MIFMSRRSSLLVSFRMSGSKWRSVPYLPKCFQLCLGLILDIFSTTWVSTYGKKQKDLNV